MGHSLLERIWFLALLVFLHVFLVKTFADYIVLLEDLPDDFCYLCCLHFIKDLEDISLISGTANIMSSTSSLGQCIYMYVHMGMSHKKAFLSLKPMSKNYGFLCYHQGQLFLGHTNLFYCIQPQTCRHLARS